MARSHAAVVNHVVQAFGAVYRGADGANLLARRVLTLLAGNRLKKCRGIEKRLIVARWIVGRRLDRLFVVAVDADPMHFAAAHDLILADYGDVVFRLAGDHAGIAAIALVQVDGHRPLVSVVGIFGLTLVKREFLWRQFRVLVGKVRILAIFLERAGLEDLAAFHPEVILPPADRLIPPRFLTPSSDRNVPP